MLFDAIAVSIQIRLYHLKDCRDYLDSLAEASNNVQMIRNSPWYKNILGYEYIGLQSEKKNDPDFESGVVEIQRVQVVSMTLDEKRAYPNTF